jgi:hypothetical protein
VPTLACPSLEDSSHRERWTSLRMMANIFSKRTCAAWAVWVCAGVCPHCPYSRVNRCWCVRAQSNPPTHQGCPGLGRSV